MRHFPLYLTFTIALTGASTHADPFVLPESDDTVRCMAIGCAPGDYERYPEYIPLPAELPVLDRFHPEPPVHVGPLVDLEPIVLPLTEDDVRQDFQRVIRDHANGDATLEQVEAAYKRLLPYQQR